MENLEANVRVIVQEIIKNMNLSTSPVKEEKSQLIGVFSNVENAVAAAGAAFKQFQGMGLETRRNLIRNIRRTSVANKETLAKMAANETGFGRWEDKVIKTELAALKTPGVEDIEPLVTTDEHGLTLTERAPYGIIGSIIPCTNATATVVNNAIGMLAAGNAVVFNAHPSAKKTAAFFVDLINKAIIEAGGPANLVCCIEVPTIESAKELMSHPKIALLVVTGGPAVVKTAMNSGKKVIAAGPGNPPCVVDETADIEKAGKDIVAGASFDNNVICTDEKEVIVVESVADKLKEVMRRSGAYELNADQIRKVTELVIHDPGRPGHEGAANKKYVGMHAEKIARDIGLTVPPSTRLLLCEVPKDHPLMWTEQLMPVLPLTRVKNVDEAIDYAVEVEHGFRHTASMHSTNIAKLSKMARAMNCSLFVKNGPNFAGLGVGGAGYTSFTIATPTGEGLTRARTFTRERRCTLVDYFRIV